jgi:aryl-alcohol dehydrogenase-like predicted oxidoreductase
MIGKEKMGNTGITVSELALGTMYMGSRMSDAQSDAVLSAYLAHGGTFIDTANNYAHWVEGCQGTESESYLGRWFQKTGRRSEVFLATKVGFDKKACGKGARPERDARLSGV